MSYMIKYKVAHPITTSELKGALSKGLKRGDDWNRLMFEVCTKLKLRPCEKKYDYIKKKMCYEFSYSGSDLDYPNISAYFNCEKIASDESGAWVKPSTLEDVFVYETPNKFRSVFKAKY